MTSVRVILAFTLLFLGVIVALNAIAALHTLL